jgi:hypothetical protein
MGTVIGGADRGTRLRRGSATATRIPAQYPQLPHAALIGDEKPESASTVVGPQASERRTTPAGWPDADRSGVGRAVQDPTSVNWWAILRPWPTNRH